MKYYIDVPIYWEDPDDDERYWEGMFTVGYSWTPGCPEQRYGDYPHPADPPEADVFDVDVPQDAPIEVHNNVDGGGYDEEIYDYIMENHEAEVEGDRADYEYDAWKDRQLEG